MASGTEPTAGPADLALTRVEKAQMAGLYIAIGVVTLLAFAAAFRFLPHQVPGQVAGGGLLFTGLAITAYVLGIRHGFDADHIAAIDNTTRKLLNDGKRPLTVGTWFSLGHSTIVCAMIVALVVAFDFVEAPVRHLLERRRGAWDGHLRRLPLRHRDHQCDHRARGLPDIPAACGTGSSTRRRWTSRWTSGASSTGTSAGCSR